MPTTTAPCSCASHGTQPATNERPRYYARQLVTPDDFTLEQDYFRAKMRRHNRFLHGFGVVCGARVVASNQPWKVIVQSGYILGPYGDEIYIETDQCIDVHDSCTPAPPDDNGCHEARRAPTATTTQWVAVQYQEKQTRLVAFPPAVAAVKTACASTRASATATRSAFLIIARTPARPRRSPSAAARPRIARRAHPNPGSRWPLSRWMTRAA